VREPQVIAITSHPRNGTVYGIPETSAGAFPRDPVRGRVIIVSMDAPFSNLPDRLRPFVRDGRITALPAKRAVRLLLLDQVAQAFEPGRRYPESEVNEILKALYDDHATLRRYLIDEELMSRTPDGTYWRSGGTVPVR
jgi:hypothetical protein